jgi:hypothetical protein
MDGCCIESKGKEAEKKFVDATAELVCEILNIGWNDKRIVHALLVKGLSEKMDNRWKDPGFLQQYSAYVLEEAGNRFYYELGIPKEVKINHDNAEHAKYADIVRWIVKNYQKGPELLAQEAEKKAQDKGPDELPNPTNPKSNPEQNARG